MRTHCTSVLMAFALVLMASLHAPTVRANTTPQPATVDFSCSGPVHAEAMGLWQSFVRGYVQTEVLTTLNKQGDVYALYNVQAQLQSFVEMARRCKDRALLSDLANLLTPAFSSLTPIGGQANEPGWICTGGSHCSTGNKLLGKEVQLTSTQFLGLLGATSTAIVEIIPQDQRSKAESDFVGKSASTIALQLNRWLSQNYLVSLISRSKLSPEQANSPRQANTAVSYKYFLDTDLWIMDNLADLAELQRAKVSLDPVAEAAFQSIQQKHQTIVTLFNLFLARTSIIKSPDGARAELDRGFWANHDDSIYAKYSEPTAPVTCLSMGAGKMLAVKHTIAGQSYIDTNLGWDFDHSRRLVPALATISRNIEKLRLVYGYANQAFDPRQLTSAFARQITSVIWNRDEQYPLFSNYWDGSNGWYGAGANVIAPNCRPGRPPYDLTWVFPTGGYAEWGGINNKIRSLERRFYFIFHSNTPSDKAFVAKYYYYLTPPPAGKPATAAYNIWMMSYLASVVDD